MFPSLAVEPDTTAVGLLLNYLQLQALILNIFLEFSLKKAHFIVEMIKIL